MKRLKVQSIFILTMFIFASSSIFAQYTGAQNKKKQRISDIPDLTEQQRKQIKKIKTETKKFILPVRNEIGEKEARLQTITTVKKVDMKKINKVLEEISALKLKIVMKKEESRQEIRALLNDDQRVDFDMQGHEPDRAKPRKPKKPRKPRKPRNPNKNTKNKNKDSYNERTK